MALQFNPYLMGANGLIVGLYANMQGSDIAGSIFQTTTSSIVRVFPNTVPFPSAPLQDNTEVPAGHMAQFSNMNFSISGSSIVLANGTNTSASVLSSGTVGWFVMFREGTTATLRNKLLISDSIGVSGSNSILTVNASTFISGNTMTINAFNLRLI